MHMAQPWAQVTFDLCFGGQVLLSAYSCSFGLARRSMCELQPSGLVYSGHRIFLTHSEICRYISKNHVFLRVLGSLPVIDDGHTKYQR